MRISAKPIVILAFLLTGLQIFVGFALAPGKNIETKYNDFCSKDCTTLTQIATHGYGRFDSFSQANTFLFPGLPLASRLVQSIVGIEYTQSTILISQVGTFFFWVLFILTLRSLLISWSLVLTACLLLFSYPSSFFLVSGYTESWFFAGLLSILYHPESDNRYLYLAKSALAGFMGTLRITGLSVMALPVLQGYLLKKKFRIRDILLALIILMGPLIYFIYCHYNQGGWNSYFITGHTRWRGDFKPSVFLTTTPYSPFVWLNGGIADAGKISVPIITWILILFGATEVILVSKKIKSHFELRVPYYLASLIIFFAAVSSTHRVEFEGMLRFSFQTLVPLSIYACHLFTNLPIRPKRIHQSFLLVGWAFLFLLFFFFQLKYFRLQLEGMWVA